MYGNTTPRDPFSPIGLPPSSVSVCGFPSIESISIYDGLFTRLLLTLYLFYLCV